MGSWLLNTNGHPDDVAQQPGSQTAVDFIMFQSSPHTTLHPYPTLKRARTALHQAWPWMEISKFQVLVVPKVE